TSANMASSPRCIAGTHEVNVLDRGGEIILVQFFRSDQNPPTLFLRRALFSFTGEMRYGKSRPGTCEPASLCAFRGSTRAMRPAHSKCRRARPLLNVSLYPVDIIKPAASTSCAYHA